MSTDTFASRWLRKEQECGLSEIHEGMVRFEGDLPGLDPASRQLLRESGLPKSAAPFLSFEKVAAMRRIYEVYSPGDWWSDGMRTLLAPFRMIGSDGEGNPICVDENTGEVWIFDHEARFLARQFMNSSIVQMAECLLAYLGTQDDDTARFEESARAIDPRAVSGKGFWNFSQDAHYWAEKWAEDPDRAAGRPSWLRRLFGRS